LDRGISSPLLPISKLGSLRVVGGQKSGKNKQKKNVRSVSFGAGLPLFQELQEVRNSITIYIN
jgi:hypothetical protein